MGDAPENARIPPHDLRAEAAVLSACMVDPSALDSAASMLTASHFYSEAHRRVFEACIALSGAGKPVDLVQVATWLKDNSRLAQAGGVAYVTELLGSAPAVVNVEAYATTVMQKAQLRALLLACQRIEALGYGDVDDVPSFVDEAEQTVYEVARTASDRPRLEPINTTIIAEFDRWRADNGRGAMTGVPTGLAALDDVTAGLHDGELTIIAARPSMGKSSLAVDIAWYVATIRDAASERPYGAALFSLEMPKEQIADRTICSGARIDLTKARRGLFTQADWSAIMNNTIKLAELDQFLINDTPALTITAIRAMVRDAASDFARRGKKLKVVVVDYLQLMEAVGRYGSREQEVASMSKGLKRLAKEMKLAVVALAQLNRGPEARTDKRPLLSDLRESGSVEQDADNVIFIYRDEYYNEDTADKNIAELIVAKQRNGPTRTAVVGFNATYTQFYNLNREYSNGP
jgi:replicative DNA helicase